MRRILADELGGGLDAQDLFELGQFQCYARISDPTTGERLPSFSVQLEPPPTTDLSPAEAIARDSAERYGRDVIDVELDLQSALARIAGPRHTSEAGNAAGDGYASTPHPAAPNAGVVTAAAAVVGAEMPDQAAQRTTALPGPANLTAEASSDVQMALGL